MLVPTRRLRLASLCCALLIAGLAAAQAPGPAASDAKAGALSYPDGRRYEGPLLDGQAHGQGVMLWPDGTRYEGEFVAGRSEGRGRQRYANGDSYDGGWSAGKRQGEGVMSLANGDRFEGRFEAGIASGLGRYLWAKGARFEGELAAGRPSGKGRLQLPSGDSYEGSFVLGQPSGAGLAISAQGWRFEGEFRGGLPTERGRYSAADGSELQQPVAQAVREALSLKLPPTGFLNRPLAAAMVCTRMPKPDVPSTGSWKGEAVYRFVVTVSDGKVSNVRATALKHPGPQKVDEVLVASFTKTFDGYHCPGNHVFVQEFQVRVD